MSHTRAKHTAGVSQATTGEAGLTRSYTEMYSQALHLLRHAATQALIITALKVLITTASGCVSCTHLHQHPQRLHDIVKAREQSVGAPAGVELP